MKYLLSFLLVLLTAANARAEVRGGDVLYKHGDTVLEGYLAYDDAFQGKRPGVLIVHEWTGLGPYVKKRAEQIAALGYVAFAADIYGKGVRPQGTAAAAKEAKKYRSNRALMRARVRAGLDELKGLEQVDPERVAAIGYCFGGGVVLELARSGVDIAGVVSFHGNLDTPRPDESLVIKGKVLVLHGADDPHVGPDQVAAFENEMSRAGVDWRLISYENAVHSFTNPEAGHDPSKGSAYDREADQLSWEEMKAFLGVIFAS